MNDQLQQALAAIINKSLSGLDKAVGFLSAEIPDVIRQLLTWKMYEALFWASVLIGVSIGLFFVARKLFAWAKTTKFRYDANQEGAYVLTGLTGILAVVALIFALSHLAEAMKIAVAPKIWLIEYAAKLVK